VRSSAGLVSASFPPNPAARIRRERDLDNYMVSSNAAHTLALGCEVEDALVSVLRNVDYRLRQRDT
jgi:hypothetical protein